MLFGKWFAGCLCAAACVWCTAVWAADADERLEKVDVQQFYDLMAKYGVDDSARIEKMLDSMTEGMTQKEFGQLLYSMGVKLEESENVFELLGESSSALISFNGEPPIEAPGADTCAAATVVGAIPYCEVGITNDTLTHDTDISCNGTLASAPYGFWYQYTPSGDCTLQISESGSQNVYLTVYDGTGGCGGLVEVACTSADQTLQTTGIALTNGTPYYILVSTASMTASTTILHVSINCGPAPGNDACAGATALGSLPASASDNNQNATDDPESTTTCTTGSLNQAMWYSVTGTGAALRATTCNYPDTNFDTKLQVWDATAGCAALACVAGNDDQPSPFVAACGSTGSTTSNRASTVTWCSTVGTPYAIAVGGFSSDSGCFDVTVEEVSQVCGNGVIEGLLACGGEACDPPASMGGAVNCGDDCQFLPPVCGNGLVESGEQCDDGDTDANDGCDASCMWAVPGNDTCPTAVVIPSVPYSDIYNNELATDGPPPAAVSGCNSTSATQMCHDIWWSYSPTTDCVLVVDADAADYDGVIAIYEAADCAGVGAGTQVFCDDSPEPFHAEIPATTGNTYFIQLGDWGSSCSAADGGITPISVDCLLPVCGNGATEPGEECDDGNTVANDGCSPTCTLEGACCFVDGSCLENQDETDCANAGGDYAGDGVDCITAACPTCGDGVLAGNEQCDDGNTANGDGCDANCNIECGPGKEPPTDSCAAPRVIVLNPGDSDKILMDVRGTTGAESTDGGTDPAQCGLNVGNSVWFLFTPPMNGFIDVNSCNPNTEFDTVVAVWAVPTGSGCDPNDPTAFDTAGTVACSDDGPEAECDLPAGCTTFNASKITGLTVLAGNDYYIKVASYNQNSDNCGLCLGLNIFYGVGVCGDGTLDPGEGCDDGNTANGDGCDSNCQVEPITNDDCITAIPVTEGSYPFSTVGATLDATAPTPCDTNLTEDVWFAYTAGCTGTATIASGCADAVEPDTVLEVFGEGTCPPATTIGCADDNCGLGFGFASTVDVPVTATNTYLLRISGWNGSDEVGTLVITCAGFCGDGTCGAGEDQCNCPADCGTPPANEGAGTCNDTLDNDCDGTVDCFDNDCLGIDGCPTTPIPTMTEWGVIAMVMLLLSAGTIVFARRRRVTA